MGKGAGPRSAATWPAPLLTSGILTLTHRRALSPESSATANPIIIDLCKGLVLSAVLHVPAKGHLVIKTVDLSFHLGLELKCFWFQTCAASSPCLVSYCWQPRADGKETFIGPLLLVRHYSLQCIQTQECSINTESWEECPSTRVLFLMARRIHPSYLILYHNQKGQRVTIWTIWKIWKWQKS